MGEVEHVSREFRLSVDTIVAVARRWKFIVIGILAATVAAVGLSFLLPKTYRATTYLQINPSPYKTSTIEQAPLEVDTYETLLKSPGLLAELKNALALDDLTVEDLSKRIWVSLVRRPDVQKTTYAPVILLEYTGSDPRECQRIVNAWAEHATSMSLRLKTAVIQQDNERIRSQFHATTQSLECQEDEMKAFDVTSQLDERKADLEAMRKQIGQEREDLEKLRVEWSLAEARRNSLKRHYELFFAGNAWLGTLASEGANGTNGTKPGESTPLQLLHARDELLARSRALAGYKTRERVEINEQEYESLVRAIERLEREINSTRLDLAQDQAGLQSLEAGVNQTPRYLAESKIITDEALWTALANNPAALDAITSRRLVGEQLNPVWLSMQERIEYLKPEIAARQARLTSQESLLVALRKRQTELYSAVTRQAQDVQNFETGRSLAHERYEALVERFNWLSEEILFQEIDAARLREEVDNSERELARLTSASLALNEHFVAKTLEKERLQRELTNLKNLYTVMAQKYEEARITELEVSGDLQIAHRAPLPERSIGPNRALIASSAFLCAAIFFLLLAVVREYLDQMAEVG